MDGHVVERVDQLGAVLKRVLARNSTGYLDGSVATGFAYTCKGKAVQGSGTAQVSSPYADPAAIVSVPALPAAPTNLAATAAISGKFDTVTLVWTDNVINETGVTIQRATSTLFNSSLLTYRVAGAHVSSWQNGDVPRGKTYYYRVRATNLGGDSAWSNTVRIRTP